MASPEQAGGTGSARLIGCFLAFVLASSGVYLVNDARDADRDRQHWRKQRRPVASGLVPAKVALVAGAACLLLAIGGAAVLGSGVATVIAVYVALCLAYSAGLKEIPVLEVVILVAGFYLRTLAGSVASGISLSPWFISVVFAGALFLTVGKREAELRELGPGAAAHRAVLGRYRIRTLRLVRVTASVASAGLYAGWALTRPGLLFPLLAAASLAPMLAGLGVYSRQVDAGQGDAPEEMLLQNRSLQWAVLAWILVFGAAVLSS